MARLTSLGKYELIKRIAACLKHPNIVHLYDVGRSGQAAYLAMELN